MLFIISFITFSWGLVLTAYKTFPGKFSLKNFVDFLPQGWSSWSEGNISIGRTGDTKNSSTKKINTTKLRNRNSKIFDSSEDLDYGHLRATIDKFDDYLRINELFKINGVEFQSKVFEGHDHGTNFFGERFGPMILYLLYSKESA